MKKSSEVRIYNWAEEVRQKNYLEFAELEPEVKKIWWMVQQRIDRGEPPEGLPQMSLIDRIRRRLGK